MNLFRSVLLLASLCLFIMLPYSIGHGIATKTSKPFVVGIVCGLISFALLFIQARGSRETH